jgi:hypothetical protein
MPRFFKVKIQHTMMIPEKEMKTVLAGRADLLDQTDDKELEWQILDDAGTVNALELLAVLAKARLKIQVSVLQEDPEADDEFQEDVAPDEFDAEALAMRLAKEAKGHGYTDDQRLADQEGQLTNRIRTEDAEAVAPEGHPT